MPSIKFYIDEVEYQLTMSRWQVANRDAVCDFCDKTLDVIGSSHRIINIKTETYCSNNLNVCEECMSLVKINKKLDEIRSIILEYGLMANNSENAEVETKEVDDAYRAVGQLMLKNFGTKEVKVEGIDLAIKMEKTSKGGVNMTFKLPEKKEDDER